MLGRVNFFGHAVVALDTSDGAREPEFVLGSMLPDLCGMAALRWLGPADGAVADGVRFHHRTDEAFHGAPIFCGLMAREQEKLEDAGLAHGSAMAVAHVGIELLLDGWLAEQRGIPPEYRRALEQAPELQWRQKDGAGRFELLRRRILSAPLPEGYRDPLLVADRLVRILAARPRLALDAPAQAETFRWAPGAREVVAAVAADLVGEVRARLEPGRRRAAVTVAVVAAVLGTSACRSPEQHPPSAVEGDGGSDDAGSDEGPPEDPCAVGGGSGEGGGAEDEGPVKFDVGTGELEFPTTCADVAETTTNLGCEFWAVDLPNDWQGTPMSPPAADQQFAVVVANASALEPAQIEVFLADGDTPIASGEVEVDATREFALDPQSIDPQQSSSDGFAFRIASSVPVTAYQFNPLDNQVPTYSNDASLLFPTHALAEDYAAVTGDAVYIAHGEDDPDPEPAGAFVAIVATQDDTMVDVFPTGTIHPTQTEGVLLDRGRVLTILSDAAATDDNLSGTRVIADRPVAVFSGNVATVEPIEDLKCCADHLEHQMLPMEAWSTGYAVAPPPGPAGGDDPAVYRITAAFDDTELTWCPTRPAGAPSVLDGLETVDFETDGAFTVRTDDDRPIAITQFLLSNTAIVPEGQPGDPAMIALPAADQFQSKYVFAIPAGYELNFVTILARDRGEIRLDGELVPEADAVEAGVLQGRMHRYVHRTVGVGSHRVEAEVPIAVTVVGYGQAVSYGFPGGVGLRVVAATPPQG
jgi:hypothetical protein